MCGICGKFYPNNDNNVDPLLLKQMTDTLKHRGPDAEGFYVKGPIGLGHRRLKIIDLSGGVQPMFNEDRSLVVVFNGEIYNFAELKKRLQHRGHVFKTNSDTEVLLHGYEEWNSNLLGELRGMFAFAIWDDKNKQLFLARDRLGIKPLYYYQDQDRFLFASEIKAILQDPTVARDIEPSAVDDYLTYMYIPAPKSIFKNIYKLCPGHYMLIDRNGAQETEYWDISFRPGNKISETEISERLEEELREAVKCRLISDVPLGAFLSGGIDSSAVVGIMSGLTSSPVNTASIGFQESEFDELPFARMVAQRYKTNACEQIVRADAANILDQLVWHYDEPFADSSMVPTFYVSEVARQRVTVALSGDGGDENFAGYRRYRYDVFENRIRSVMPQMLRRSFFGTIGRIYPKADWLPQIFRAKTLLTNLANSPERAYFHSMSWFHDDLKKKLYRESFKKELGNYDAFSVMEKYYQKADGLDALSRTQYVDIKTYLVDDILTKVDRASMAHALEVRVPLLDHRFMEFAASIPYYYKLKRGEGKYIFKRSISKYVPDEILNRPKRGFSIPLAQWLRRELVPFFQERVFSPNSFLGSMFEMQQIEKMWKQHQHCTRDFSYHLWALLILESWSRRFLNNQAR